MKAKVYLGAEIDIPDELIPGLAERAKVRLRRQRVRPSHIPRAVDMENIIEQANIEGVIELGNDVSYSGDEVRIFYRGEVMNNGRAAHISFNAKRDRTKKQSKRRK